jgi:hypothetical protein
MDACLVQLSRHQTGIHAPAPSIHAAALGIDAAALGIHAAAQEGARRAEPDTGR